MTYESNGITIATVLEKRNKKRVNATSLFYVKIRVTYKRTPKYYPTNKKITEAEWQTLSHTKSKKLFEIRKDIEITFDRVKMFVKDMIERNTFSFEQLNEKMNPSFVLSNKHDTLNYWMRVKIDELDNEKKIGTKILYECTLSHIEKLRGDSIPLSSITPDWLTKYENDSVKKNAVSKEGLNYTSLNMYCRNIRHIINRAITANIIHKDNYPFGKGKYIIPTGAGRNKALSLSELKQIVTYTDGSETTERYRDWWFFSYLCNGANFADILRLKYANIRKGEIVFFRAKSTSKDKKEVMAYLTPEMEAIIQRWGNKDRKKESYIFPHLQGHETPEQEKIRIKTFIGNCNRKLKKICEKLNINADVSTYTARHSFATVLKRSGANIAYISESLGHSNLQTTENYLASFEKEEREKNAFLLTNFDVDDNQS